MWRRQGAYFDGFCFFRFIGILIVGAVIMGCSGSGLEPVVMKDQLLEQPLPINTRPHILAIGSGFSVGIKRDGTVWTWGENHKGILARPLPLHRPEEPYTPRQVVGLEGAVSVSASESVLVLMKDGSVWSWGRNDHGQLGYKIDDGSSEYSEKKPRKIPNLPKMKAVSISGPLALALDEKGVIWAWGGGGKNSLFEVDGGVPDWRAPTPIEGLPQIMQISTNAAVIAAIDIDGGLWTIGVREDTGRRVSESEPPESLIGRVPFPARVVDVDVRSALAGVALLENGQVWTWGRNYSGQLGLGHRRTILSPERIKSLSRVTAIATGVDFMVAATADGDIAYWGNLIYGRSPEPLVSSKLSIKSPVLIKKKVSVHDLVAGGATVAYVGDKGDIWYWGWNRDGVRGTGVKRLDVPKAYVLTPELSGWAH